MRPDDAALLRRELAPGEVVLWQGAPRMRAELLAPGNWLFAICWIGFSLGWTLLTLNLATGPLSLAGAMRLEPDSLLPLIGVLACLGGPILLMRPIASLLRARRTLYAVTDRRLLRIENGRRLRVLHVPLRRIDSVVGSRKTPGWGTVRVSVTTLEAGRAVSSGAFNLRGVPDAAKAYALLADGVPVSLAL